MSNEKEIPQQKLFLDEKNFLAEFLFDPDIQDEADFSHLDKNLGTTRLSSRWNEPERARALLVALHTLTKTIYFYDKERTVLLGYDDKEIILAVCESCGLKYESPNPIVCSECGKETTTSETVINKIPIYTQEKQKVNFYPKSFHNLKSKFYSLTTTAAARDGHLMRSATTTNLRREESIEDKTAVKGRWGSFGSSNQKSSRY
jgi:hypothetical protein